MKACLSRNLNCRRAPRPKGVHSNCFDQLIDARFRRHPLGDHRGDEDVLILDLLNMLLRD
jgi:hypothetical protein